MLPLNVQAITLSCHPPTVCTHFAQTWQFETSKESRDIQNIKNKEDMDRIKAYVNQNMHGNVARLGFTLECVQIGI